MFEYLQEFWIPWTVSNTIALLILWAAVVRPKIARAAFALLFAWACWINLKTANQNPGDYLAYAELTPIAYYKEFILGMFKENITTIVSAIAVGQGLIALGMLGKGWMVKWACWGAMFFFLGILPLGIGSGFPVPIIGMITAYFILKKDDMEWIWSRNGK